jgi:hypothetical protein
VDKTLEIILVAVVLVVAAVILVGLLQGQAGGFGSFADNQTSSASCGVSQSQYCGALDGSGTATSRAKGIHDDSIGCDWTTGSTGSYPSPPDSPC